MNVEKETFVPSSPEEKVNLNQPVAFVQRELPIPQPADYLCLSIFNIFCCFWPLGIVALIKSLEVRSHYTAGRYQDAQSASAAAKLLNTIGIAVGLISLFLSLLFVILAVALNVAFIFGSKG